ncbi:MAG TPA: SbcC/MukB-like Walker B domain-containing protein, partial [Candidatus Subteraquimicrobiales bacterium]
AELTDSKYTELELTEDYEVLLYDQGQKFPLDRFSGGEKDLVNLCLRLAISELMTETSRSDFGFIVLDEIFGSQDPLRKTNIMRALAKLSSRFRQIFLITHVEEVKDSMEYVVSVSEDESGVSHLTLE